MILLMCLELNDENNHGLLDLCQPPHNTLSKKRSMIAQLRRSSLNTDVHWNLYKLQIDVKYVELPFKFSHSWEYLSTCPRLGVRKKDCAIVSILGETQFDQID